jgi:hypothetical protein
MVKMVQVSNVIENLDQFDYEILFQINKWKVLVKVLKYLFYFLRFFYSNHIHNMFAIMLDPLFKSL